MLAPWITEIFHAACAILQLIHLPSRARNLPVVVFPWARALLLAMLPTTICSSAISQVLPFSSYSVKDGLLSNGIHTFFQDSEGYLWIGTRDGISVFDGWTFSNYTTADGLPSGSIKQILEERGAAKKTIWIVTAAGEACRLVDGKVIAMRDSALAGRITSLGQDHTGTIWVGGEDTLARIVGERLQGLETGMHVGLVDAIKEQGDSVVWIGSRSGLTYYSFRTGKFKMVDVGLQAPIFTTALLLDSDNNLWISMNNYALLVRDLILKGKRQLPSTPVSLSQDQDGDFWFCSYAGLYRLRKSNFASGPIDHFTTADGLSENKLRAVFVDREDNVWIGGIAKGVSRLPETNIHRLILENVNPPYQYSIGAADSNGHIWVVTTSGALWETWADTLGLWHQVLADVKEGGGNPAANHNKGGVVKASLPLSIFVDHRGRLWVGYSNAQVACYEVRAAGDMPSRLKLVRTLRPKSDFPDGFPGCFIVDRNGRVWYSQGNRILLLDPGRRHPLVRIFSDWEGIATERSYIRSLLADKRGNIWAGFYATGVVRLDADSIATGSFHPFPLLQDAFYQRIASISEDNDNRVWIASETNGLTVFDNGTMETMTVKNGLPSNIVTSVTEDKGGRIWVSTGVGVAYLEPARSKVIRRKRDLADSYMFCSGVTTKGLVWFVTIDGLVVYDPTSDVIHVPPLAPLITTVRASGMTFTASELMTLAHDRNNIEIGFISMTFRNQRDVRYQYRLSGIDADWGEPTTNRAVTYAALPPGKYTFEVRAFDAQGVSSERATSLDFSIRPPFWGTWWFYGLLGSVTALALFFGRRRKIAQLRRETLAQQEFSHRLLNSQEQERKRIAGELHDSLGQDFIIIKSWADKGVDSLEESVSRLAEISAISSEAIRNVREIAFHLRPYQLDRLGLTRALESIVAKVSQSSSIRFMTDVQNIDGLIPHAMEIHLYRIVQEAVNNIIKHSAASEARVAVARSHDSILVDIIDNGKGFAQNHHQRHEDSGLGLHGIAERVAILGGTSACSSIAGSGTKVNIRIPIQQHVGG